VCALPSDLVTSPLQASKIPIEEIMKKENGVTCTEYVSDIDGVEVSSVAWRDNKTVTLLSTFAGKIPISEIAMIRKKNVGPL
jgi:hypothetical protein